VLYYKETPIGELDQPVQDIPSEAQKDRQEKVQTLIDSGTIEIGKKLEAKVIQKKASGKKVKYEIFGISYEEKEPKTFNLIPEQGLVLVEIKSLKDDGGINHVKFIQVVDV
jgi:hypothetical protein